MTTRSRLMVIVQIPGAAKSTVFDTTSNERPNTHIYHRSSRRSKNVQRAIESFHELCILVFGRAPFQQRRHKILGLVCSRLPISH